MFDVTGMIFQVPTKICDCNGKTKMTKNLVTFVTCYLFGYLRLKLALGVMLGLEISVSPIKMNVYT